MNALHVELKKIAAEVRAHDEACEKALVQWTSDERSAESIKKTLLEAIKRSLALQKKVAAFEEKMVNAWSQEPAYLELIKGLRATGRKMVEASTKRQGVLVVMNMNK